MRSVPGVVTASSNAAAALFEMYDAASFVYASRPSTSVTSNAKREPGVTEATMSSAVEAAALTRLLNSETRSARGWSCPASCARQTATAGSPPAMLRTTR